MSREDARSLTMDSDGPAARVERTFWAVWYYITGAVNRFLRPETTDISNDNTNSNQEFPASGPTNLGPAEGDAEGIVVAEEKPPATSSLLGPPRPVVSWELGSGDINSGPDEESMRYETQASRGSDVEPSEEDEEAVREFVQAGLDDARLLVADRKLSASRQDETTEHGVCEEHAKTANDPTNEDMDNTGRKAAAQEETEGSATPQDPGNMSETPTTDDETGSQDGNTELKRHLKTDLSLEEEDKLHIEEVKVQRNEEDTTEGETTDSEPQLKSEEENQLSVSEDSSDDNRDFKEDPSFTSQHVESQMTTDESGTVSEDEPLFMDQEPVMAHRSESDELEDAEVEESESTLDEDAAIKEEIMNEATNKETLGDAPEQKDDIITVTEDRKVVQDSETELHAAAGREEDDVDRDTEVQNKASKPDDDETESCFTMSEEKSDVTPYISVEERIVDIDQVEESDAVNIENNIINEEKPLATASLLSPGRKPAAQEETEGSATPQDPRNMSETPTTDDETGSRDGNTELKCRLKTDLSLEEEDTVHIEEVKVQRNKEDTAYGETTDSEPQLKSEEENELSVNEDSSDDNRDFKEDPSFTSQHVESQMTNKSGPVSEDEPLFMEPVMARRSESDELEDAEVEESEGTLDEDAAIKEEIMNEATNKETLGDAPEQKDDIITVTEDRKVAQDSETELHAAAGREEDDVDRDTEVQNKASEPDDDETESCGTMSEEKSDVTTYISVEERIVDIDQSDAGNMENNFINEEKPLVTASLLSPNQPLVSLELGSGDINSGPNEESMQYETQTSRGSNVEPSQEDEEGMREEQFVQAGLDDAELLVSDRKLSANRQDETPEYDVYEEQAKTASHPTSEDMDNTGRKPAAQEETEGSATPEDPGNMSETPTTDDETESQDGNTELKWCLETDLSLKDEDDMQIEEVKMQRNKADTAEGETTDGVPQLKSEEENQLSVSEDLSDDRDFKEDPSFTSQHVESQKTTDESGPVSEDEPLFMEPVMARRSESDELEDAEVEESESTLDEDAAIKEEIMNEATNKETLGDAPEQKDDIITVTEDRKVVQDSETELHAAAGREEDDVDRDTEVQNKASKPDDDETESCGTMSEEKSDVTPYISVDERIVDTDQVKGESDAGNMENNFINEEKPLATASLLSPGRKAAAQEETEGSATPQDPRNMSETQTADDETGSQDGNTELKRHLKTDLNLEEEDTVHIEEVKVQRKQEDTAYGETTDGEPQLKSEEENQLSVSEDSSDDNRDFKEDPSFTSQHVESQKTNKSGPVSEDEPLFMEPVMARRSESDEVEKAEVEDAAIKEEIMNEAPNKETAGDAPEQTDNIITVTEDRKVVQDSETELHAAAGRGEDDVDRDTEVQNKASEPDDDETESCGTMSEEKSDVTTYISVEERIVDQKEEERLLDDVGNIENNLTTASISTSVTVKPEGETGWEMSREFINNPPGICEGQVVVLQELNFPTCEEMQEGVPEYNNEPGPDEHTTQRFLEEGDCKELQGSQLPEEAEHKEPESLENSGCSTRADYLLVGEHMEKEQESTQDIKESLDAALPQKIEEQLVETVSQESEHFFEEEEGKLLIESMKTGIRHSEKQFESDVGLTEETEEADKELHEEILIEYDMDKVLCDAAGGSRETTGAVTAEEVVAFADEEFLDTEGQEMTGSSFFQYVGASFDDVSPNFRIQTESADSLLKDLLMEDELQNTEILTPLGAGTAELESAQSEESMETERQPSDETREISHQELFGVTAAADESMTLESKPNDLTLISTDKVEKHVTESEGSYHNVIEEEILDLWLQTALSEDTDRMKQQEPGQRVETSNEEQEEITSVQTETDKDQLVELKPKESELLLGDTNMSSSSTVESGFLDQSPSEQNSKTQLQKLPCTESLMSDSESQDIVMEETADAGQSYLEEEESMTETGFHPDSGVPSPDISGYLNQDSDMSQENTEEEMVESAEPETGTQKPLDAEGADWKDIEEEDAMSVTEISALIEVEEAKTEDDPLFTTVCNFPEEIKHPESGRSRGNSETLKEDEIVLTEPGSHGDADAESKKKSPSADRPQPGWSQDVAESLPGLNGADVAEKLIKESVDQIDNSALDFTAQRSRIAIKNPRVRPPKDPRSLLHMPSVDPTPSPLRSAKVPAGVPLGGLGMGIKLPGLGAGFPILKKTQRVVRDETSSDTVSQEVKPQEKSDSPKQDEAQHKPKWMPPRHPGFGNPLMSELKTKLKKTTKE